MSDKLQEKESLCEHGAYHCLSCENKAMELVIEEYKEENANLIEQLEQVHKRLENCMQSHERLEVNNSRLKKDKQLLQAVHHENYAKAAHRAGVIEELQAANQKLVECLEWYGDGSNYQQKPYNTDSGIRLFKSAIDEDNNGQRARQTLSEVKGNDRSDS